MVKPAARAAALFRLAGVSNAGRIEHPASLRLGIGDQRAPISVTAYQRLEDVADVADQLAVLPRHHVLG